MKDTGFPGLIADRYALEEVIGRGGMAAVARVVDRSTGARVALKRMSQGQSETQTERAQILFEREYRTLSQLVHPRIVAVFDYGRDGDVPFYTMELLDGGDLSEQAPVPWRRACEVGRDVCAALSLVHARAMVYRDLSLRNVRCTSDGKAKLLDFGAMAPVGSAKFAVCTPSVAAPEVVNMQALGPRTDLYALGATLYQALTGKPAYGANSFRQLELLWKHSPAPPSTLVRDIPEALDGLVMDLLQLDPNLRPVSAAEVGERLRAIAGLEDEGQAATAQAYLTTPTLMGRDGELARVQRRLQRLAAGGRGGAMALRGHAGTGRSRLLDACVLQGKLDGHLVLRVTGDDGQGAGHDAARAIAQQLLVATPTHAIEAADAHWQVLCQLLPGLAQHAENREVGELDAQTLQALAVRTLRDWLLEVAARQPLVLAVDDVERLDGDSRNLIALLAEEARRTPLLMLVARNAGSRSDCAALELLDGASRAVLVKPLSLEQSAALAASLFGEAPNLQTLVQHLHGVSEGNPRNFMLLAQHLVDQGIVEHRDGVWVLPRTLQDTGAPASMADALRAEVDALPPGARSLGAALSLTDPLRFEFDECVQLGGDATALSQLLEASVLIPVGSAYRLSPAGWASFLLEGQSEQDARTLHGRLAAILWARGDGVRAARHYLEAGEDRTAVERLAEHSAKSSAITNVDPEAYVRYLDGLPEDWMDVCSRVLEKAVGHPRERPLAYAIRQRLAGIISTAALDSRGHNVALSRLLAAEAGLDLYEAMADEADVGKRLQAAIGGAMQRHAARPEDAQVCEPIAAIRLLASTTIAAIGNISNAFQFAEWEELPSLAPLTPLSPAIAVVHRLAEGFDARRRGQYLQAIAIYEDVLDRIAPPKEVGLDQTYVVGIQAGIHSLLGLMEASLGRAAWAVHAEGVRDNPIHATNATRIESLAALWQGDAVQHARLEHALERLRLEQRREQPYEPVMLVWRFLAHAVSEDLTGVGQALRGFERLAAGAEGWKALLCWGRGEYERVRGDQAAALGHLDEALQVIQPGRHQLWPHVASSRLLVLCALGRHTQALSEGKAQLDQALAHGLGLLANGIRMSVALAAARAGDAETAQTQVAAFLAESETHQLTGLNQGLAHEAAASVAVYLRDADAFQRHAPACREVYLKHPNRALSAKYQRLMRAGRRAGLVDSGEVGQHEVEADPVVTQFASILDTCTDPQEGVLRSMDFIVEQCEADGAHLFVVKDGPPELRAQVGSHALPDAVKASAARSLEEELEDADATGEDTGATALGTCVAQPGSEDYRQLLLGHYGRQGFVVSGLLVLSKPVRELSRGPQLAEHLSRFIEAAQRADSMEFSAAGSC